MWFVIRLLLWQQSICQSDNTIQKLLDSLQPMHRTKIAKVPRTFPLVLATCTKRESNSTHLPDFELGRAAPWGRDVPPERPRPVLRPLGLLTALPVLVPPCTQSTHIASKQPENQSRESRWRSGCPYPRRRRAPCRQLRGNATRQSPPEWTKETIGLRELVSSAQQHTGTNLAGKAEELRRTWTILTPARSLTGPGELSVLVSGGCPSVPRWFHPQVKSCMRAARNPKQSNRVRTEQNRTEARQEMNNKAAAGRGRGRGRGRTRPSSQMARELRLPATTAVTA